MSVEIAPSRGPAEAGAPVDPVAARRRRRQRVFRRIKWSVRGVFLLVLIGVFIMGCDSCFYFPTREIVYTPKDFRIDHEEVAFETQDGVRLWAWFLKPRGEPKGTVIHFHGNAQNISTHILGSYWLTEFGYQVLVFDYRGYGKSQGGVSREGTIRDGRAALDYVLSREDVDPKRIVAFGQSLGGAVATIVAAERPEIAAVVLDAPFADYRAIAARHVRKTFFFEGFSNLLAAALVSRGYEPIEHISRIAPRPVLVIASGDDSICFPDLARELYEAAAEPREFWLVEGAEHLGMIEQAGREGQRRIAGFFDAALGRD